MTSEYEILFDRYFPFRLYAEHARGKTTQELAAEYNVSAGWVEERIEAARLCIEKQVRIEPRPHPEAKLREAWRL
jgi:hypothetical protein